MQSLVRSAPLRHAARSVRRAARYIGERARRCEGLPSGLDVETLDALCREHGKGGLKGCVHLRLSGWKPRGAHRLEILTEAGGSWRLIFKDECYWSELRLIPALDGLPASPGPPEAIVYRSQSLFLARFLPQLFWFREVERGRHFQYLLEDLAATHAELRPGAPPHVKARGLLEMHQALKDTFADAPPDALIRYDRGYSERLLACAGSTLADYLALSGDGAVEALLGRFDDVTSVHQRDEFYDDALRGPIHGDFVMRNLLAHRHDQSRLKVLDWEWAGIGLPHADLAALAMSLPREDRAALVQAFTEEDRRLEAEQHRRLFHWSQLERSLLDATRLARKQLASPQRLLRLRPAIRRSAAGVLASVERLSAGQNPRSVVRSGGRSRGPRQGSGIARAEPRPGDGTGLRGLNGHPAQTLRSLALRSITLRRVARYVRDGNRRCEGLPRGLEFETLDALCREHGRGGLKRCVHLRLSGWKSGGTSGTYRLELLTEGGSRWRLIFKDECYRADSAPALEGLPVSPGPPEAIVYGRQDATLSPFLPRLFWLRELEPGRHLQYLLEDLAGTYAEMHRGAVYSLKEARALGLLQVQQALRKTFVGPYPDGLIRYDRRYSERLLEYAGRNLADYLALTADTAVARLRDRWQDISSLHERNEFYDHDLWAPIHGDFAVHNLLAHRHDESRLKVLDWEWAGIGLPHADLAALIKYVRQTDQPALLQAFMAQHPELDPEGHRRLLDWCQLERWLFHAAFLARQQLLSQRRVPFLMNKISDSAGTVLLAAQRLGARRVAAGL